jgi:hypothetical protein
VILIHLVIEPHFFWNYDGFARIDRCLGDPKNNWGPDSNRTQTKLHNICQQFIEPSPDEYLAYTIYIVRSGVCWVHVVFLYLVTWNVFEMVIYFRIFAFMKRYQFLSTFNSCSINVHFYSEILPNVDLLIPIFPFLGD